MTELKTLKDLVICPCQEVIKAEAIKWVKEERDNCGRAKEYNPQLLRWMERLNITEEDLKELENKR